MIRIEADVRLGFQPFQNAFYRGEEQMKRTRLSIASSIVLGVIGAVAAAPAAFAGTCKKDVGPQPIFTHIKVIGNKIVTVLPSTTKDLDLTKKGKPVRLLW